MPEKHPTAELTQLVCFAQALPRQPMLDYDLWSPGHYLQVLDSQICTQSEVSFHNKVL